jgi:CubicO group peptidase (beta-lactamase class C family)
LTKTEEQETIISMRSIPIGQIGATTISPNDDNAWTEVTPSAAGMKADRLEQVTDRLASRLSDRHFGAQLVVLRGGRVVLDRSVGFTNRDHARMTPRDRLVVYSLGKPFAALCVHLLAERGLLALDKPVSAYWPEYGQHGKQDVTVRQVLQHRTGSPMAGRGMLGVLAESFAIPNWAKSIRRIEEATPWFAPGSASAYQFFSYGFICGELVRRATGKNIQEFFDESFARPLGLTRTSFGLPPSAWGERVVIDGKGAFLFNWRRMREAVCPSATTSTTAREVAAFYEMLRLGGRAGSARLLREETILAARQPSSDGEVDRFIKAPVRWSQAFMLGGVSSDEGPGGIMGRKSSRETFGFGGSSCCVVWCDPGRELVSVYLCNKSVPDPIGFAQLRDLSDLILDACDSNEMGEIR